MTAPAIDRHHQRNPHGHQRRRPGLVDPFGLERRCTKPVIAVVQGITYTVGIEMALAQDIVIAADAARYQQLESFRGIAPLGGAHFRHLSRTGWGHAMHLLFTCEEFSAERALQLGFVQEVHPLGRHMERAASWPPRSANARRSACVPPRKPRWPASNAANAPRSPASRRSRSRSLPRRTSSRASSHSWSGARLGSRAADVVARGRARDWREVWVRTWRPASFSSLATDDLGQTLTALARTLAKGTMGTPNPVDHSTRRVQLSCGGGSQVGPWTFVSAHAEAGGFLNLELTDLCVRSEAGSRHGNSQVPTRMGWLC